MTTPHLSIRSYTIGFLLSLLLTALSFWFAPELGSFAPVAILICAFAQLFVQLVFFLHLGRSKDTQSDVGILMFTTVIICILIGGTLWIMTNLAHLHMHSPTTTDLYEGGVVAPENELK